MTPSEVQPVRHSGWRRLDPAWWLILGVAAADAALLLSEAPLQPWRLAWKAQLAIAAGGLLFALIRWVYGSIRPAPRLAALAHSALLFVLYTDAVGCFSYLLTGTLHLPLIDRQLEAIDRSLGFDWPAYRACLQAQPQLWLATQAVYLSLGPQVLLLVLLLDVLGRADRARELFLGFALCSLTMVVMGALLPAAGAFVEYGVPEAHTTPYVLQYLGLRDGSLRLLDPSTMEGVVQFPSFHAGLALICCYVVRGLRWLFWPSLMLNLAIVAVTPVAGGHHFSDVLVGLPLAAATLWPVRYWPAAAAAGRTG